MLKRILVVTAIILAAAVFLSGCDALTFNSAENLVRPPKLAGADGELQAAFEKAVGEKGEYILKYPSSGEYRSAYVRHDCDSDGEDEAFVFYSLKAEEMSVFVYMLDYQDGEWIAVGENPGEGNDVYSIEFCDLNSDGTDEVFIGWRSLDSKANRKLTVLSSDRTSKSLAYKIIAIETFTAMYTVDIDSDSQQEILLALINSTSDAYTTQARLLKMKESGLTDYTIEHIGETELYSGITAINSMKTGLSGGRRYVYIDETAGNSYLTEMLYWDKTNSILSSAFVIDEVAFADCPTSRSLPLVCSDVNRDGELEIPVTTLLEGSVVISKSIQDNDPYSVESNIYCTSWKKFAEGNFRTVSSYIFNEYDGFRLSCDEEFLADYIVKFFPDDSITQVFLRGSTAEDENSLPFTVKKLPHAEVDETDYQLAVSNEYTYICEITENGENAGITTGEIRNIFSLSAQ